MTTTKKVKLKRVAGLKRGDVILPGRGLFTRAGVRLDIETATWGGGSWFVTDPSWMNDVPELSVSLAPTASYVASDILHTPLDAYVVLAA